MKPGQKFTAIEKVQGLKKGEHVVVLAQCECISNLPERLEEISERPFRSSHRNPSGVFSECELEGFVESTADEFIGMFCKLNKGCSPESEIRRVEFRYLD